MSWQGYGRRPESESQTREPLPGLLRLPAWLWRKKLRLRGRLTVGVAFVAAAGALVAAVPGIRSSKRDEARRTAHAQRAARARIVADQRPQAIRLGPGGGVVGQLQTAILRDARRRAAVHQIEGPIVRVSCTPGGPAERGRTAFRCEALGQSRAYPFLAVADASAGVLTWCKRDPPPIADQDLDVPVSPQCSA